MSDHIRDRSELLVSLPPPTVIVGLAPASAGGRSWDPKARSTVKIAELASCEPADLGQFFGLSNILDAWPGSSPPSRDELREAAGSFRFVRGFRYLLLGSEVARALGRRALPAIGDGAAADPEGWFMGSGVPIRRWFEGRCGAPLAYVPHPSGRNRWYNRPGRKVAIARFVQEARWQGEGRADDLWRRA